jgi:curved DNA-binding protein CbpA
VPHRKLAVQWHPDKHPKDPEAAKAKFQEINEAYVRLTTSSEDDKVEQLEQKRG